MVPWLHCFLVCGKAEEGHLPQGRQEEEMDRETGRGLAQAVAVASWVEHLCTCKKFHPSLLINWMW